MGQRGVYTQCGFSDKSIKELYDDLINGKKFSQEEAAKIIKYLMYPKKVEL